MKKYFLFFTLVLLAGSKAEAVCPVCTVAVGAGVGFSRYLGIDDAIAGLWIGGLIVSVSMWTINWLKKKNINFNYRAFLVTAGYYLLTVVPLFFVKIGGETLMGHPFNKIWGIDKLLLGIILGSAAFYGSSAWYEELKKKNDNHARFPFQKVVMPVAALAILSVAFYFITR